jgi:hypothetical protein
LNGNKYFKILNTNMKKTIILFSSAIILTGALSTSCTSPAQKVENEKENVAEATEDLKKANDEYLEDIATFRKENADKIAENDRSIAEFKARIAAEKKEIKADYKLKIAELEKKNSDFKKKLDEYQESGKDKWYTFKLEFRRDMDELANALKDLTTKNNK